LLSVPSCSSLTAGSNMTLSSTTALVSDPPVKVTCLVGFVLDTNQTNKLIQCELVSGSAVWNDTVGTCIRKYTSDSFVFVSLICPHSWLNKDTVGELVSCVLKLDLLCLVVFKWLFKKTMYWYFGNIMPSYYIYFKRILIVHNALSPTLSAKQCPSISTVIDSMMTSEDPDIAYYYGDTVTINCDDGAAFSIDSSKDMPDRIANTSVILCDDDLMSLEGVWTNITNCTGICHAF